MITCVYSLCCSKKKKQKLKLMRLKQWHRRWCYWWSVCARETQIKSYTNKGTAQTAAKSYSTKQRLPHSILLGYKLITVGRSVHIIVIHIVSHTLTIDHFEYEYARTTNKQKIHLIAGWFCCRIQSPIDILRAIVSVAHKSSRFRHWTVSHLNQLYFRIVCVCVHLLYLFRRIV